MELYQNNAKGIFQKSTGLIKATTLLASLKVSIKLRLKLYNTMYLTFNSIFSLTIRTVYLNHNNLGNV